MCYIPTTISIWPDRGSNQVNTNHYTIRSTVASVSLFSVSLAIVFCIVIGCTFSPDDILAVPDKHKFDSRTYVRPKKRPQRPSIQSIVESSPPSLPSQPNKYLTYNKYSAPLGPLSPILRLKTFNVETDTENSNVIKEYTKRRSLVSEEDPQVRRTYISYSDPLTGFR